MQAGAPGFLPSPAAAGGEVDILGKLLTMKLNCYHEHEEKNAVAAGGGMHRVLSPFPATGSMSWQV